MSKTRPLGSIVDVSAGHPAPKANKFSDVGRPFIRAGSLEGLLNGGSLDDCEKISDTTANELRFRLYPENTIVFAKSGMSATLGRIYRLPESAYVVSHLAALAPTGKCDSTFLTYWLRRNPPSHLIRDSAYPSIRVSDISELQVPDIPFAEQQRIAAILDKTDAVIAKCKNVVEIADSLILARFLELFGDPLINPRGFEPVELEELCQVISDCLHTTPAHFDEPNSYPSIRSSELQGGYIDLATAKYVTSDEYRHRIQRHTPVAGDVIYCREGARYGNVGIIPDGMTPCLGQRTMLFQAKEGVATPEFLWVLLRTKALFTQADEKVGGAASPHVNISDIRKFKCFKPPMSLQARFSKYCRKVLASRSKAKQGMALSATLFKSLYSRAFRGDL